MHSVVVYLTLSTQNKQSIHYMDITYVYIAFYYSTYKHAYILTHVLSNQLLHFQFSQLK